MLLVCRSAKHCLQAQSPERQQVVKALLHGIRHKLTASLKKDQGTPQHINCSMSKETGYFYLQEFTWLRARAPSVTHATVVPA